MPLEHVSRLFARQQTVYTDVTAYDYFCMELENILYFRFGVKDTVEDVGDTDTVEDVGDTDTVIKEMLRSAVVAVSYIIHLHACFTQLPES